MIFLMVFCVLSTLTKIHSNSVTSPQIRILDVATKASESRLIPHRVEYRNMFRPLFQQQNHYGKTSEPLKSYVIYDDYPMKIFKEWKADPLSDPQNYLELKRQQNVESPRDYYHYFQIEQQIPPQPKPTLAYHSVYSNVIKVFDSSLEGFDQNRFQSERYIKPFERDRWKSHNPIEYEPIYPQDVPRRSLYHNLKLPENFPKVFSPNEKFHFPSIEDAVPPPPKFFYPKEGFYDVYAMNYNKENSKRPEKEVEILPEVALRQKIPKKTFLCSFIRVNQRQFPENGGPCSRSDEDLSLILPQYPDYSNLPNDKIPLEHRRQHFQMKRTKRSELKESNESRQKRETGFGYGYSGWGSPFSYENGYEGYFGSSYPNRGGYRNNYNSGYTSSRNRNQGYRSKYYSGSQYDDRDEDYQNNDDSNSRGLTGYLTNGGRRYKNRKNNNEDEDENDDNENDSNNPEDDSEEEMEQMNSNRRDTNDRKNNDDSRDRRRNNNNNNNNNNSNNNNNDDDDYRDNRRSNNRNNNSRRNNNSNNNRRNNDRYDYGSNRNRYYGYNNNGYGSSYGGYGSNYGGSYGTGGYGSGYGNNRGYGYGGYGNGFGSF